jgi:hypothetical protein
VSWQHFYRGLQAAAGTSGRGAPRAWLVIRLAAAGAGFPGPTARGLSASGEAARQFLAALFRLRRTGIFSSRHLENQISKTAIDT